MILSKKRIAVSDIECKTKEKELKIKEMVEEKVKGELRTAKRLAANFLGNSEQW